MKKVLLALVALSNLLVIAQVSPANTVLQVSAGLSDSQENQSKPQPPIFVEPIWERLRQMTAEEKANAIIQIELADNAVIAARSVAQLIENFWNNGQYDNALIQFDQMARYVDSKTVAIGISWRKPRQITPDGSMIDWYNDIRISDHDSALYLGFDIDRASGNLFAAFVYQEGSNYYWALCFSNSGGLGWEETYVWMADSPIDQIGTSVLGNFCYVSYSFQGTPYEGRLRRLRVDNGVAATFSGSLYFVTVFITTAPDTINQTVLCSNQDSYSNRLYYSGLTSSGHVRFLWDDTAAVTWTEIPNTINDASLGLDISFNVGADSVPFWVSYIDQQDTLNLYGINSYTGWRNYATFRTGPAAGALTAIGAYHDTITCFYDYFGTTTYIRYAVSYNGGHSWFWGWVGDTTVISESPDITARNGGGLGVIYRFYTIPREGRFSWRNYSGAWNAPTTYTNHVPYWNKPVIEYLGDNNYGIVYLAYEPGLVRVPFFDHLNFNGICEYLPGDINGDGIRIGGDVTYGVRYLKGVGAPPQDSCYMDSISDYLYVAGDVNGNCEFRGSDITRLVAFFKGTAVLSTCHFFPGPPLLKNENTEFPEIGW